MKHVVVFTLHDTNGRIVELLEQITPKIKQIFDQVYMSVTPATDASKADEFIKDEFFKVNFNEAASQIGDHFISGIRAASEDLEDEDIIHISTLDRLAFELNMYEDVFIKDMGREKTEEQPLLYTRSEAAWATHPQNYRAIESLGTELCQKLYGIELDLFWCDLAMKNKFVKEILPTVKTHDLRTWVELIWPIKDTLILRPVDWLSWEDPFVFKKDPLSFKKERENEPQENQKRWGYVRPAIEWILDSSIG